MNPVQIEKAFIDRLNKAQILLLMQGPAHNTLAPDDVRMKRGNKPYVVVTLVSGSYDDTFESNIADAVYQVSTYDHKTNGIGPSSLLWAAIYGDSKGTDNTPTHGLHRHTLIGMTGMSDAMVIAQAFGTQHDADTLHFWQTFGVQSQEV